MTQARARNNHYKAKATVWDLGLSRCWRVKAPAWRVNKVTWRLSNENRIYNQAQS